LSTKASRPRKTGQKTSLTLRLAKSGISTPVDQKATIRALGFRRVGDVVEREDNASLRGRIRKIRHLVEVIENRDGTTQNSRTGNS